MIVGEQNWEQRESRYTTGPVDKNYETILDSINNTTIRYTTKQLYLYYDRKLYNFSLSFLIYSWTSCEKTVKSSMIKSASS